MNNNTSLIMVLGIVAVVFWRITRSTQKPIKGGAFRFLLPILLILPGIPLMLNPNLNTRPIEMITAVALGLVLSIPLVMTTNFEIRSDGGIYRKKSMAFIFVFVGVLLIRLAMRNYFYNMEQQQMIVLFYLVAVSYLIPWRISSYLKFKKVLRVSTTRADDHQKAM